MRRPPRWDNETEAAIQRSLEHIARTRTTIAIAHRLSTVRHADRIFVLEGGAGGGGWGPTRSCWSATGCTPASGGSRPAISYSRPRVDGVTG